MAKTTEELMAMVSDVNAENGELDNLDYFSMEEFDEILDMEKPWEIARKIHFGDFNPMHEYFTFDGYGNLESVSDWELERKLEEWEDEIMEAYGRMEEEG